MIASLNPSVAICGKIGHALREEGVAYSFSSLLVISDTSQSRASVRSHIQRWADSTFLPVYYAGPERVRESAGFMCHSESTR